MKEYDKAIADYDQAIRMEPRANFYTNRGDSYQFKGELGRGAAPITIRRCGSIRISRIAYNNRAVLYKKMGERAKALADYEAALRLDPGNENAIGGRRTMKAEIARFGSERRASADAHPTPIRPSIAVRRGLRWRRRSAPIRSSARSTAEIADTYARLINNHGRPFRRRAAPGAAQFRRRRATPASASRATTCTSPCSSASTRWSRRCVNATIAARMSAREMRGFPGCQLALTRRYEI